MWRKIPVVRILIPFLVGILLGVHFPATSVEMAIPGACALIVLLVLMVWPVLLVHDKYLFNACIHLLLISLGMAIVHVQTVTNYPAHYSQIEKVELVDCVISETPENGENTYKTSLDVRAVVSEGEIRRTHGKLLLYVSNKTKLFWEKGDRVLIASRLREIEEPANPDEFDYKEFMFKRGVTHRIFLADPSQAMLIHKGFQSSWLDVFDGIREECLRILNQAVSDRDAFGVSSALILGQKEFLSPQIRMAYAGTGAMHVLAVSGLHVGIIYLIIMAGLKYLGDSKTALWIRLTIVLMALWSYAVITGLSPSVVRASTMFSAVAIAQNLGRKTSVYNTLALAALVMLCSNPYLLFDVGFQLSFTAVLAIVLLQPKIYALLFFSSLVWDKIWQLTSVSIAAQIGTFPLGILYFHQFPNYFMLTNLIVIPGAFVILIVGIALLITSRLPVVFEILGNLLNLIVVGMNAAVRWIESLPQALSSGLFLSNLEVLFLYSLMALGIAFIYNPRPKLLTSVLVCGILLLGGFTYRVYDNKTRRTVIVNQVSNHLSLNLIDGDRNILVSDSVFIHQTDRQRYHLANHWYRRGHQEAIRVNIDADSNVAFPGFVRHGDFISFHGYRIQIQREASNKSYNAPKPETDLLITTGGSRIDSTVRSDRIVVSSGYRYKKLCCDSVVVPVYDVRERGALVVELNRRQYTDTAIQTDF